MSSVIIEIEQPLAAILRRFNDSVQVAAREMIVLELHRRGTVSSGKAAEILGMARIDFIKHASRLGIPHVDMTEEEWASEKAASEFIAMWRDAPPRSSTSLSEEHDRAIYGRRSPHGTGGSER